VLLKLSAHISNCLELAALAEQRAREAVDPAVRNDNERLAESWHHLARSYQFVESLERFLSDSARKKDDALPPELQALVEELPAGEKPSAAPESRTIIRRPRVKHELSFKDRLLKSAQEARDEAARLPAGSARDRLLLKARQSETAANIDVWISSPGSPAPENLALPKKPRP
jgi:hypothetical protein